MNCSQLWTYKHKFWDQKEGSMQIVISFNTLSAKNSYLLYIKIVQYIYNKKYKIRF